MITMPRSVARSCRAVFRRLPAGRSQRGGAAAVALSCGPDGLRVRYAAEEAAAEFLHPSPGEEARLVIPLETLAACEGRWGDAVFRPLDGGRVQVEWNEAGASRTQPFACTDPSVPDFPSWPDADAVNDVRLLAALDRVMDTAAKEGGRYALNRVQLRGRKGEVVGTDGSQLLIEGGFSFPWEADLLVPRVGVFAAPELAAGRTVRVGLAGGRVLFGVGGWTVALKVAEGERYPNVEAAVPSSRSATVWRPGPGEAAALARLLPDLPGGGREPTPVTIDLGRAAAVRARGEHDARPAEVALPLSSVDGKRLRFAIDRRLLARACALGFPSFSVAGPGQPVVCRDGARTFVCVTMDGKDALPPHPFPVRVPLDGKTQPAGTAPAVRAGGAEARPRRKAAATVPAGGLPSLFGRWSKALGRLTELVSEQRRRERSA